MSDKIVPIRKAIDDAKPAKKKPADDGGKKKGGPPSTPPPPSGGFYGPPARLPHNAPVQALGRDGNLFYFLDCKGQFCPLEAQQIGRNQIIALFGGSEYLIQTWPAYGRNGEPNGEFKHGLLSPVLIASCNDKPLFDPKQRLRSLGAWAEEDGTLIWHCGDVLHVSPVGGHPHRIAPGMRGGMLYPSAKRIPEPILDPDRDGADSAAAELLRILKTWNWVRGDTDAKLIFGWICAALLGAAQPWRPMIWVTGGAGTGKSLLSRLVEWVLGGEEAIIKSDDATAASIFQLVGQSCIPVVLDELEAKANNKRAREVVQLARLAASGGRLTRGGADGTPLRFVARNCFFFSSILIPPLMPQDISRMAILELDKIEWDGRSRPGAIDTEAEDEILGRMKDWVQVGRELRGTLTREWHRYRETIAAHRRALARVGHDARGADQFGALGAAYDCVMHEGFDARHADDWAAMLPAAELSETRARQATEYACLAHLLSAQPDVHRAGKKATIASWLQSARRTKMDKTANVNEADDVLKSCGIRIFRDRRDGDKKVWWIAISNTHQEIARIFKDTDWAGEAGTRGTWAQAFARVKYAMANRRMRIDGVLNYLTVIPWEEAFPPKSDTTDRDARELVASEDAEDNFENLGT